MAIETVEDLFAFIQKEERHVDLGHLKKSNETTVACGDPLLHSDAAWRIVGG